MAIELKLGEDGVYDDNTIWLEDGVTKFVEYPKVVLDRIANSQEEEEQILLAAGHAANEIEVIEEAEFEVIPLELQEPDGTTDIRKTRKARH